MQSAYASCMWIQEEAKVGPEAFGWRRGSVNQYSEGIFLFYLHFFGGGVEGN